MPFTNSCNDELATYLKIKLLQKHATIAVDWDVKNQTNLKMHEIPVICYLSHKKYTKYETCAILHRFRILYISRGFTPRTERIIFILFYDSTSDLDLWHNNFCVKYFQEKSTQVADLL